MLFHFLNGASTKVKVARNQMPAEDRGLAFPTKGEESEKSSLMRKSTTGGAFSRTSTTVEAWADEIELPIAYCGATLKSTVFEFIPPVRT